MKVGNAKISRDTRDFQVGKLKRLCHKFNKSIGEGRGKDDFNDITFLYLNYTWGTMQGRKFLEEGQVGGGDNEEEISMWKKYIEVLFCSVERAFGYIWTWNSDEKYMPKIQIWKSQTYDETQNFVYGSDYLRLNYRMRTWKGLKPSLRKKKTK